MNEWLLKALKWSGALLLMSAVLFALGLVALSAIAMGIDWDFKLTTLPNLITRYSELITGLITGILALGGGAIVLIAGREQISAQKEGQQQQIEIDRHAKFDQIIFDRRNLATILAAEIKISGTNLYRLQRILREIQNNFEDESEKLQVSKNALKNTLHIYVVDITGRLSDNFGLLPRSAVSMIMLYQQQLNEFRHITPQFESSADKIIKIIENIIKIAFHLHILLSAIAENITHEKQDYDSVADKDKFWGVDSLEDPY